MRAQRSDALQSAIRHLSRLSARGATPQQLVDLTSKLTRHACVYTDSRQRVIATDSTFTLEPAVLTALQRTLAGSPRASRAERLQLGPANVLTCPVVAGDTIRGHLSLIPVQWRLRDDDPQLLSCASTALAAELRVAAARHELSLDQRRQLAQALLEDRVDSSVEQLAAHLDVPLLAPRIVGVIEKREDSGVQLCAEDLRSSFESQFGTGTVLATPVVGSTGQDAVVVLVDISNHCPGVVEPDQIRRMAAEATRRADPEPLVAAFSALEDTRAEVADAYATARRVMHVLRTLCPAEVACLTQDDLGFAAPLLHGIDRPGALLHVRRVFGAHGQTAAQQEQRDTVAAYFAKGRVIRDTARCLGVHENTVRYRLKKFDSTSGLDVLNSAEDQLTCQLALLIDRLMSGDVENRTASDRVVS